MKRLQLLLVPVIVLLLMLPTAAAQPNDTAGILPRQLASLRNEHPGSGASELGALAADCVRQTAGADLAIVPAGDLENDLPVGALIWSDITRAVNETRSLAVTQITAQQLFQLLENALSHLTVDPVNEALLVEASDFDGFPHISGFSLTVDASAPVGERVYAVTLDSGTRLSRDDSETMLTLASTEYLLSGGYGFSLDCEWDTLHKTLADAIAQVLTDGVWTDTNHTAIRIIGVSGNELAASFPLPLFISILAIGGGLCIFFHEKQRAKQDLLPMREGETKRTH